MRYRSLGRSGLKVSAVGLGGNNFGTGFAYGIDEARSLPVIQRALDLGITCLDTADVYSRGQSEEIIGKAIAGRRHEVVLATKVRGRMGPGPNDEGLSRAHLLDGVEASLRRLGTDYIDLYQLHRPDETTPIEETLRALDDLVRAGKVRYLGCSNFAAWHLVEALWTSDRRGFAPFVSAQPHYNLLHRDPERELLPACARFGVGILPYFPLASGLLTGKYRLGAPPPPGTRGAANPASVERQLTPETAAALDRLAAWAEERGHTLVELAIAWLLAHPEVSSVIAGATRPEQVETNAKAADWELTADDLAEIEGLLGGRSR